MLSLQRWWLVTAPTDLRCGIDRLLLAAQTAMHRTPAEGEAYRKLPRQAGSSKVELSAYLLRYSTGVIPPSESWDLAWL
ncbi:hypothetical protein LCZ91_05300 [Xanthomonas citri pv. mangiferaeindicae]|nr:hypothetical protein [Xanthomonas citri]UDB89365.1 hypothetical protein LCZ91_05300 [Xanthomonas citri pv. mangiferaeindicae]UDI80917.1 hypothetical protein XCM_8005 [Xanthomonas citri pv. mangiferaeindicae]